MEKNHMVGGCVQLAPVLLISVIALTMLVVSMAMVMCVTVMPALTKMELFSRSVRSADLHSRDNLPVM